MATALVLAAVPAAALDPERAVTQYLLDEWKAEQGLPLDTVEAVLRSRDGYLWVGTQVGLARFDGARFVVFDRQTVTALPDSSINALLEDRAGALWIGTSRGLAVRRGGEWSHVSPEAGELRVAALVEDGTGTLWVGTRGAGLWRLAGGELVPFSEAGLPGRRVRALRAASGGVLWAATEAGVTRIDPGGSRTFTRADGLPNDSCFDLWIDPDGSVWVATDGGIAVLREGAVAVYGTKEGLGGAQVRSLLRDRDGSLWAATQGGGVSRLRDGRFQTLDQRHGLSSAIVNALFEDFEGSLWLGTAGGGLARLRDGKVATFGAPEGLPNELVYSIFEDRERALWFGMSDGGVARLKNGDLRVFTSADGLPSEAVTSLAETADGLWVGTYGGGLARLVGERFVAPIAPSLLPNPSIYSLLAARDGGLWIGTGGGGLARWRDGRATVTGVADGLPGAFVQALLEDADGSLWIGTEEGLAQLRDGRLVAFRPADGLPDRSVLALHQSSDGALWIGTANGLGRFRDGRFAAFGGGRGLASEMIGRILEDGAGRFWMTTNRGLLVVAREALDAVADGKQARVEAELLGVGDGMRSAECFGGTQPAGTATRDGRLWFPTVRGAVVVDPQRLPTNPIPPPVAIEEVVVDGVMRPAVDGLRLPAGSHALEIHYTGLSLLDPSRVRFRYRLEGFDPLWTEAGTRRVAYYTEPPPGAFRFRVLASNNDGLWSESGASLALVVSPHLYETWWFRLVGGLLVAAALYGAYRLRVWRLEARQRELEAVVDDRTAELRVANGELERLASLDGLTRIANRRSFDEALRAAWADHRRRGASLAVVLADVDFFKRYNDRYGHPAGDRTLIAVAQALAAEARRETDLAARYGGEEMALLLRDTDLAGAVALAGETLAKVRALAIAHEASDAAPVVTLSLGVAAMVPAGDFGSQPLVAAADAALYRAKAEGRNRVRGAGDDLAAPGAAGAGA